MGSVFNKDSCDPDYTNVAWPCRGSDECTKKACKPDGTPTALSCWRYSFRNHMRICWMSGGFMIQLVELEGLGKGQIIEADMARLQGIKVFKLIQNGPELTEKAIDNLAEAIIQWLDQGSVVGTET